MPSVNPRGMVCVIPWRWLTQNRSHLGHVEHLIIVIIVDVFVVVFVWRRLVISRHCNRGFLICCWFCHSWRPRRSNITGRVLCVLSQCDLWFVFLNAWWTGGWGISTFKGTSAQRIQNVTQSWWCRFTRRCLKYVFIVVDSSTATVALLMPFWCWWRIGSFWWYYRWLRRRCILGSRFAFWWWWWFDRGFSRSLMMWYRRRCFCMSEEKNNVVTYLGFANSYKIWIV